MEIISVLRRFFNEDKKKLSVEEINKKVKEIIIKILKINNLYIINIKENFDLIESESMKLMYNNPGQIKKYEFGEKYKFIGVIDALNLVLAKKSGCVAFYSSDKSFKEIEYGIQIRIV